MPKVVIALTPAPSPALPPVTVTDLATGRAVARFGSPASARELVHITAEGGKTLWDAQ